MLKGPVIKLTLNLQEIEKYFFLNKNKEGPFDYDLMIDRIRYDEVEGLLKEFHVKQQRLVQEFCFIVLWIEGELKAFDNKESSFGKYYLMWNEIDSLRKFMVSHRITEIKLNGESGKNIPGEELVLRDDMNIDRICDGLRSIFRKEFQDNRENKSKTGQSAWKKKKMGAIKNILLRYLDSVPKIDALSLESQFYIIGKLAALAGFYKSEEELEGSQCETKSNLEYREYLVQKIKLLK